MSWKQRLKVRRIWLWNGKNRPPYHTLHMDCSQKKFWSDFGQKIETSMHFEKLLKVQIYRTHEISRLYLKSGSNFFWKKFAASSCLYF